MLIKRVLVSVVVVPLVSAAVWLGGPWLSAFAVTWGSIAAYELYHMVGSARVKPLTGVGLFFTVLFILNPHFDRTVFLPALLTASVAVPLIWLIFLRDKEEAFARWVWTLAGYIYIGWLLSYYVALRNGYAPLGLAPDGGRNWVFFALFTTFVSDSFAYLFGKKWGRHRLAPKISPGKSWEGAAAGLLCAAVFSLFFLLPTPLRLPLNPAQAVLLGVAVSIFGQIGDLAKSLLKRNMGVKDSSRLLPGHGGFLDRLDSLLFAGVTVYYYVLITAG